MYADKNILYFNKDSDNVLFNCNGVGILNIDLNNIDLDYTNYKEDNPDTIILIRLLVGILNLKHAINLKLR